MALARGDGRDCSSVRLTLDRRRLLRSRAGRKRTAPSGFGLYADRVMAMVRSAGVDRGVSEAVLEGRRAVELAEGGADECSSPRWRVSHAPCTSAVSSTRPGRRLRAPSSIPTQAAGPGLCVGAATLALLAADRTAQLRSRPRREGPRDRRPDLQQQKLARRECGRRARRRAGRRGRPRRRRAGVSHC